MDWGEHWALRCLLPTSTLITLKYIIIHMLQKSASLEIVFLLKLKITQQYQKKKLKWFTLVLFMTTRGRNGVIAVKWWLKNLREKFSFEEDKFDAFRKVSVISYGHPWLTRNRKWLFGQKRSIRNTSYWIRPHCGGIRNSLSSLDQPLANRSTRCLFWVLKIAQWFLEKCYQILFRFVLWFPILAIMATADVHFCSKESFNFLKTPSPR